MHPSSEITTFDEVPMLLDDESEKTPDSGVFQESGCFSDFSSCERLGGRYSQRWKFSTPYSKDQIGGAHYRDKPESLSNETPIPKLTGHWMLHSPDSASRSFSISSLDYTDSGIHSSQSKSFIDNERRRLFRSGMELADRISRNSGFKFPGHFCGEFNVDFLTMLEFYPHVSKLIMQNLNPKDLSAVCCVSKNWQRACTQDKETNQRRLHYLEMVQNNKERSGKENLRVFLKGMNKTHPQGKPDVRGALFSIQNIVREGEDVKSCVNSVQKLQLSDRRYNLFIEEGKKLHYGDKLQPCPRCSSPSQIRSSEQRGRCSRSTCSYNFCSLCLCEYHSPLPCPVKSFRSKTNIKRDTIGSKKCKQNLKRL